jgi:hypothetical protein
MVCLSAMQLVCGRKTSFWKTCRQAVIANTIPEHGLIGKRGNATKYDDGTIDDVRVFFLEIESFCDVIPTWFVRDKTGLTTRDDKEAALTLPPYWSKRSLYSRF